MKKPKIFIAIILAGIVVSAAGMYQANIARDVSKIVFKAAHKHNWFWADGWFELLMDLSQQKTINNESRDLSQLTKSFQSSREMTQCFSSLEKDSGNISEQNRIEEVARNFSISRKKAKQVLWIINMYSTIFPELGLMMKCTDQGTICSNKAIELVSNNHWYNQSEDFKRIYKIMKGAEKQYSVLSFRISEKAINIYFMFFSLFCLCVASFFITILRQSHKKSYNKQKNVNEELQKEITERRHAEKKLKEAHDFSNNIIETSLDAIIVTDSKGHIIRTNKAYQELVCFSEKELFGKHTAEMSPWEEGKYESTSTEMIQVDKEYLQSTIVMIEELLENGYVYNWNIHLLRKDRKLVPVEESLVLLKDINGEPVGGVGIIRDITDRKHIEGRLQQSQKMEAVGTLAGGIAHDFNNILGGIIGYAELAQDDLSTNNPVQEYLSGILNSSERAKDLVKQILAFSRKSTEERKPLLVSSIVKEAAKLLKSTTPATIEMKLNINESSGMANADPTQIHQIVMNLCTNAVHSMHETGGVLGIDLSCIDLKDENIKDVHDLKSGQYIMLKIFDTGNGIDPDTLPRIFEPFFTTKAKEKGTGMGLSVVHGIVKSYGGEIITDSQVGKGSTFTVFLPRVVAEPEKEQETTVVIPQGTECILFVDDEKTLLDIGEKMLKSLGYTVIGCDNSLEALEIFEQQVSKIDLVITDQTMPHMTGYELAKRMLKIKLSVSVILCTGYSNTITPEKAEACGIKALIYKPISKNGIAGTIREVLDK